MASKEKKHPLLTVLLLVAAAWLVSRWIDSSSKEDRSQSINHIAAATAAATSRSAAKPPATQKPLAAVEATPYLEWVDELYVVNDIILGHCMMNGESSFVFGVSPNARAGLTDEELYRAIYDIAYRWCNDDFRIGLMSRSDGILEVYVTGATLRDGIRLSFATDLTPGEQQVLQQIRTVVSGLKRDHPNGELDIETAIYDYICAHMVYRTYQDFPEGDRRRKDCTSAVNAFLYGFGNCQAYSDLFYIMAEEAGISVQYLAGKAQGEEHLWNIVWIDEKNLMVDVTFGDTSMEGAPQPSHYWLNFGLDRMGDRSWLKQAFAYEFSAVTDERYTYYRNADASTGYAASSLNDAADYCVWKLQQGYSVAEVLMVDQSYSKKDVEKAISRRTQRRYYYYYAAMDGSLLLHVVWK